MALSDRFSLWNVSNLAWRFFQFIFAVTVIGLYAQDLNRAGRPDGYSVSSWGYAVAVGVIAAVTALALGVIPIFAHITTISIVFAWEWVLVILWAAVVGVFGAKYLNQNPNGDNGIGRMRNAAIIDIVNLCLWAVSAIALTIVFFTRGRRSLHTGRAKV